MGHGVTQGTTKSEALTGQPFPAPATPHSLSQQGQPQDRLIGVTHGHQGACPAPCHCPSSTAAGTAPWVAGSLGRRFLGAFLQDFAQGSPRQQGGAEALGSLRAGGQTHLGQSLPCAGLPWEPSWSPRRLLVLQAPAPCPPVCCKRHFPYPSAAGESCCPRLSSVPGTAAFVLLSGLHFQDPLCGFETLAQLPTSPLGNQGDAWWRWWPPPRVPVPR